MRTIEEIREAFARASMGDGPHVAILSAAIDELERLRSDNATLREQVAEWAKDVDSDRQEAERLRSDLEAAQVSVARELHWEAAAKRYHAERDTARAEVVALRERLAKLEELAALLVAEINDPARQGRDGVALSVPLQKMARALSPSSPGDATKP